MQTQRQIEIFSADCPACEDVINLVNRIACPSCAVSVLDMHDVRVAARAKQLGVISVPAVVIDGALAECCTSRAPDEDALRKAGIGEPL